jgi:hypothetical protein
MKKSAFAFALFATYFAVGVFIGMLSIEDDAPSPQQIEVAEEEIETPEPTRAECIPCNGEGRVCGKLCQYCKGYGTVPIVRLTLYPEKNDEPDCTVKLHLLK